MLAHAAEFDLLVNAFRFDAPIEAIAVDEATWDQTLDSNAKAVYFASQAAAKHFLSGKRRGKIINVCSNLGGIARPGQVAFCASQGAVFQVTKALAVEWAQHQINVNALALGTGDAATAVGKQPTFAEVADTALFLAEGRSDHLYGHILMIDAGETLV